MNKLKFSWPFIRDMQKRARKCDDDKSYGFYSCLPFFPIFIYKSTIIMLAVIYDTNFVVGSQLNRIFYFIAWK